MDGNEFDVKLSSGPAKLWVNYERDGHKVLLIDSAFVGDDDATDILPTLPIADRDEVARVVQAFEDDRFFDAEDCWPEDYTEDAMTRGDRLYHERIDDLITRR